MKLKAAEVWRRRRAAAVVAQRMNHKYLMENAAGPEDSRDVLVRVLDNALESAKKTSYHQGWVDAMKWVAECLFTEEERDA